MLEAASLFILVEKSSPMEMMMARDYISGVDRVPMEMEMGPQLRRPS